MPCRHGVSTSDEVILLHGDGSYCWAAATRFWQRHWQRHWERQPLWWWCHWERQPLWWWCQWGWREAAT
jgi:hypothetical protein